MLKVFTAREEVEKVVCPAVKVPDPTVVELATKYTTPPGVPEPGALALTVAVNVTD